MSAKVTGMVFDRYPEGGGEMLLALALADHAHDDGTSIFPSIARLAAKTRQSQRSVQYQLRSMEKSGWLILVGGAKGGRKPGSESQGRTREYRINPAWINGADIAPLTPPVDNQEKGANIAPFGGAKGAIHDVKGCNPQLERVQSATSKGATAIAPESSVNHQEPSGNRQSAHAKNGKAAKPAALFERLWQAYPRKVAKADAEKAFAKLGADEALLTVLLEAIAKQSAWPEWREDGGKFIPHPATWLNGKRWLDEPAPKQAAGAGGASAGNSDATWWETAPGIEAHGAEVWRARKQGEDFQRYKVGVFKAAGEGPWRQALLADLLRTKSSIYADVHTYFYGHPPTEVPA